eukprot:7669248-Karenia_brevis.AAC.1
MGHFGVLRGCWGNFVVFYGVPVAGLRFPRVLRCLCGWASDFQGWPCEFRDWASHVSSQTPGPSTFLR